MTMPREIFNGRKHSFGMAYSTQGKIVYITNFSHSLGFVGRILEEDGSYSREHYIGSMKMKLYRSPEHDLIIRQAVLDEKDARIKELEKLLNACHIQILNLEVDKDDMELHEISQRANQSCYLIDKIEEALAGKGGA